MRKERLFSSIHKNIRSNKKKEESKNTIRSNKKKIENRK
jgi:hypothetical protein